MTRNNYTETIISDTGEKNPKLLAAIQDRCKKLGYNHEMQDLHLSDYIDPSYLTKSFFSIFGVNNGDTKCGDMTTGNKDGIIDFKSRLDAIKSTLDHNMWKEVLKDIVTGIKSTLIVYGEWYAERKKWKNIMLKQEQKKEDELAKKEGRKQVKITIDDIEAQYGVWMDNSNDRMEAKVYSLDTEYNLLSCCLVKNEEVAVQRAFNFLKHCKSLPRRYPDIPLLATDGDVPPRSIEVIPGLGIEKRGLIFEYDDINSISDIKDTMVNIFPLKTHGRESWIKERVKKAKKQHPPIMGIGPGYLGKIWDWMHQEVRQ